MASDFEMTPRQRKLRADAREFAREVLRPLSERADAIAGPQVLLNGEKHWPCNASSAGRGA